MKQDCVFKRELEFCKKDKKMKAIMDRVFIKLKEKTMKQNGVLLPDCFDNEKNVGEVLSVGPEVKCVKTGDVVFFHSRSVLSVGFNRSNVMRENEKSSRICTCFSALRRL